MFIECIMNELLTNSTLLTEHIINTLYEANRKKQFYGERLKNKPRPSAVLMLMGPQCRKAVDGEPCLILNKRSKDVMQPGDLCCPGGGIECKKDIYLSKLMDLPGSPLWKWPFWKQWRKLHPRQFKRMRLYLTTGLREGFEEMRLNPLGVRFLGPLPPQELVMFKRIIFPLAGWVQRQTRFAPNWEVERIVHIPLRNLLKPECYALYRIWFASLKDQKPMEFPCFLHQNETEDELLWGATFRMVMAFLDLVFGFQPPEERSMPVVERVMDDAYLSSPVHLPHSGTTKYTKGTGKS